MKPAAPQSIDFEAMPSPGTVVMFRGQRYEAVGAKPHTSRDGAQVSLIAWRTHCARCGDPFEALTTLKTSPSRRCVECKQPGVRA